MDLNNLGYIEEPFILANDVAQVFYVKYMSTKPRKRKDKQANTSYDEPKCHIVLSGKRNIVGVEDKPDAVAGGQRGRRRRRRTARWATEPEVEASAAGEVPPLFRVGERAALDAVAGGERGGCRTRW